MKELTPELIEKFVSQVINIERKYGYELKNVTTARQNEIAKWLAKFVAEEGIDADKED